MPANTQRPVTNGSVDRRDTTQSELDELNLQLKHNKAFAKFHGDTLIGVSECLLAAIKSAYTFIVGYSAAEWISGKLAKWRR